jgi:hypothetical protein
MTGHVAPGGTRLCRIGASDVRRGTAEAFSGGLARLGQLG